MYKILPLPNADPIEVYCEMAISGGGFTFLPRSLTRRQDAQNIVNALFKDKKNVLLKLQKKSDRSEFYTLIQPHPSFANTDFGVLVNSFSVYTGPVNSFMKDYILLGIIQEYPTKPLRKKTAPRSLINLAGKSGNLELNWLAKFVMK